MEFENFLHASSTPVDTALKNELLAQIRVVKKKFSQTDFDTIVENLTPVFTPTYFNLARAMYPLLADAYALNLQNSRHNNRTAGLNIGLYTMPLEKVIAEGKFAIDDEKYVSASERRLGPYFAHLQQSMSTSNLESAAFFGKWRNLSEVKDQNAFLENIDREKDIEELTR